MQEPITGFYQDEQHHWVATLACGHTQHMRHDPPWTLREWVLSESERARRVGSLLTCKRCEDVADG